MKVSDEGRALLEDLEEARVIPQTPGHAKLGFQRATNWQDKYFSTWRGVLMYPRNVDFAECFEISFRGAFWLLLFGIPAIFGLDQDQNSYFYKNEMFHTGAIICFVYTLAPTVGITLNYAVDGVAGTIAAAMLSLLMYLVFPDGAMGAAEFSFVYFFGGVVGAISIVVCLFLNFSASFQVFYCANFVWFWMAFMNPDEGTPEKPRLRRTDPAFPKDNVLGFEFADWGGGAGDGLVMMVSGAALAVIVTLLPYPMTSIEQARDSAASIVNVLGKTWQQVVDFYLNDDNEETKRAQMVNSMGAIKGNINTLKEHLEGSWWETLFLPCWRKKHFYLSQLDATTSRCFERITHVVDACWREEFEDVHDEMMKAERCGDAVRTLADQANSLLQFAAERADDGDVDPDEKKELLEKIDAVEKAEQALGKQLWKSISEVTQLEKKRLEGKRAAEEVLDEVSQQLVDEQIFIFSLCDFASSVRSYCKWLAEEAETVPRDSTDWTRGFKKIVDKDAIYKPENINFTVRASLAIFIGFAIGYCGYSKIIPGKDASIPGTVAVLLSHSLSSPVNKSLGRLQGVVLGTFYGQLAYALLGWCAAWAQVMLSGVVFAYVWLCLFIYFYTSPFSYLGCLAVAFGTKAFLEGCSDKVVEADGTPLIGILIAISVMAILDTVLRMGRPSELAFGAYQDAWAAWDDLLEDLLTDKDTKVDDAILQGLIGKAEALAAEAASEPRMWRSAFPSHLFKKMINLARIMRTQVVCISTIVCEPKQNNDGTYSKKEWFKRALAEGDSIWPVEIRKVLQQMDVTYDLVEKLQNSNGEKKGAKMKREREHQQQLKGKIGRPRFSQLVASNPADLAAGVTTLADSEVRLVEDERAQRNFVFGCLQSIESVNYRMQLKMLKRG